MRRRRYDSHSFDSATPSVAANRKRDKICRLSDSVAMRASSNAICCPKIAHNALHGWNVGDALRTQARTRRPRDLCAFFTRDRRGWKDCANRCVDRIWPDAESRAPTKHQCGHLRHCSWLRRALCCDEYVHRRTASLSHHRQNFRLRRCDQCVRLSAQWSAFWEDCHPHLILGARASVAIYSVIKIHRRTRNASRRVYSLFSGNMHPPLRTSVFTSSLT